MKFAICNEIYQGWKLQDTLRHAAATGYEAVEIAPFTIAKTVSAIAPAERESIKKMAADQGMAISGIHWVLVQTEGLHLTHPDTAIRQRTSDYFRELVDFCADIGGRNIIVGSPKQRSLEGAVTYPEAWTWATEVFRPAVNHAAQRDVIICFEPLAPSETNFINTAEEAIRFTRQLDSPHFKIILDVKAMSSESKPIPEIIRDAAGHFAYFHANDTNLKGPGFGEVDFRPIAAALKEVQYNGYVSVEVFRFEEGAEAIATQSLKYLREVFV